MSGNFLANIFSRGSFARTDSPVVSVGGVSSNSATLTYDVLHFDATGNLLVNNIGSSGGAGTATSNVVASQSGTWTVQSIWVQRLDATNDAVTVYQNVTNSNWSVIASQSGNWTISAGTMTVLGSISVGAMTGTVTVQALLAGTMTVSSVLSGTMTVSSVLSGTMTVSSVLSGTMSTINLGQARTTDPAAVADGANKVIITDSLGKQVVLPGSVNDLHLDGQVATPGVLAQTLIANQGAGRRIAMQTILVTGTASALANVIISGGPNSRTFGLLPVGYGGFSLNAGGAPLYLTSASAALSVACDSTVTCNVFASGYSLSN